MVFICKRKALIASSLFVGVGLFFCILPTQAADLDTDGDGLFDVDETRYGTNNTLPDTDFDGYMDGQEVKNGYSPKQSGNVLLKNNDEDGDLLNDALEITFGTQMAVRDTDGDHFSDYEEVMYGYSPTDASPKARLTRKIVVDRTNQQLSLLVKNISVMGVPVSTGVWGRETPGGTFTIQKKIPVKRYVGPAYDYPNTKWNLQFKPQYYLHTAYWHDDFGIKTKSSGCVNMREEDVEKLYKYISVGVVVEVIGKTPRKDYVGT